MEADWAMAPVARVTWSNALMEGILASDCQTSKYGVLNMRW